MLFITSRQPTRNTEPELNADFAFDLNNNASSRGFFCCRRHKKGKYEEIGSKAMLSEVKNTKYRQVLIYIHGFSNLPETVFENASEFQDLCNLKKDKEVLVIPVIWPCDNDLGIVKDYWDDQK